MTIPSHAWTDCRPKPVCQHIRPSVLSEWRGLCGHVCNIIKLTPYKSRSLGNKSKREMFKFRSKFLYYFLSFLGSADSHWGVIFKGTVAQDFWPLVFFMNQPHIGPWFILQNIFDFYFEFAENSNSKVVPLGIIPRRTKNHFQNRGLFKHG